MAAGWPTKVTYANGDVFDASDINDTNGTLNYINPTSATDNQVLTRDAAAGGKVKWANSPANTLTTTGDLYYASAANTPARLAVGSTNQVLTVAGGVPTWSGAPVGLTSIASGSFTTGTTTISSIAQTYKHLQLVYMGLSASGAAGLTATMNVTVNGRASTYYSQNDIKVGNTTMVATTGAASWSIAIYGNAATRGVNGIVNIYNYASTTAKQGMYAQSHVYQSGAFDAQIASFGGYSYSSLEAITSLTMTCSSATSLTGTYVLYGVQ